MFDETPRLFSVADILRKRKNNDDMYDMDDFPDIKEQHMAGKYDSNFDALGSEFERAHSYNFNDIKQPENTEPDIEFSDYYDKLLKYEPSSYIKLEEDEIIPFSVDNEKSNEYYIDNLKGKTLDDLVISKMKENAGASDLPRDAMRRQFAEDLIRNEPELPNVSVSKLLAPEEIQEQEQRKEQNKKRELQRTNARQQNRQVVIEAPLSSNVASPIQGVGQRRHRKVSQPPARRSERQQGNVAIDVPFSPEQPKPRGRGQHKSRGRGQNKLVAAAAVRSHEEKQMEPEEFQNRAEDIAQTTIASLARGHYVRDRIKKGKKAATTIASAVRGHQARKNLKEAKKAEESEESNRPILKRGLRKFKENVDRNNPTYGDMVKDSNNEKTMTNLKLKQALRGLKQNASNTSAGRESILSPDKTEAATYMGGGKSEYDPEGKEIKVPRGHHPNLHAGREKNQQEKLEKKYPFAVQYKKSYSDKSDTDIVPNDILRQFNKDVSPKVHIKFGKTSSTTVAEFMKFIDAEIDRRKPQDQRPKLTAEALSQRPKSVEALSQLQKTPAKGKKAKGVDSPLGDVMGMMSGLDYN